MILKNLIDLISKISKDFALYNKLEKKKKKKVKYCYGSSVDFLEPHITVYSIFSFAILNYPRGVILLKKLRRSG